MGKIHQPQVNPQKRVTAIRWWGICPTTSPFLFHMEQFAETLLKTLHQVAESLIENSSSWSAASEKKYKKLLRLMRHAERLAEVEELHRPTTIITQEEDVQIMERWLERQINKRFCPTTPPPKNIRQFYDFADLD